MTQSIQPGDILERLPEGRYEEHFQPTYSDRQVLLEAMHELQETTPVTALDNITALRTQLANVVNGSGEPVIITGRCAEPIKVDTPIAELATASIAGYKLVREVLPRAIAIERGRGQNAKPRSQEYEILKSGLQVPSYMGDMINAQDENKRTPDPSRMVAAAVQARDVEEALTEQLGEHLPSAHEALSLSYELSFLRHDPLTGKQALLSADLPWVGLRTNDPDGPHVGLLSGLENAVGVKIGAGSTEAHIRGLKEQLNPDSEAGKLVFMLRVGFDTAALRGIIKAIRKHAAESVILYDIHGATRTTEDGQKIRAVSDIVSQIENLAEVCGSAGLRLHGIHLETIMDEAQLQCVDRPDQRPTHPGGVDPQLNPGQTREVLEASSEVL